MTDDLIIGFALGVIVEAGVFMLAALAVVAGGRPRPRR